MTDAGGDARELMARALRELQRAQQRIAELERRDREPIAIVGAACRLPGGIGSPADLWQFLARGGDAVRPLPDDRWDVARFHDPRPGLPGRIVARAGAFLDDVLGFDAGFFGIAPREAELMDPQQRLLLETGWHAFEDAGLPVDALRSVPVGVFVGISTIDYAYHLVAHVPVDEVTGHCGTGTTHAVAAGRLAYAFDLRGPCLALDTACSSSLVALHLACQSLRAGECEHALVAGVNVMLSPLTAASFSHARMLSPDGRCKTFAASADGYGRGEGAVALLLTRASTAAARGLRCRAEILGTAVNQDGRSAGLTVPNGPAQGAVIRRAIDQAGLEARDIDVVEAHGTGTALGDPIELQALGSVFAARATPDRCLRVASIKTNLGHTEAAAGALSVLKAALQLQHAQIAPHLHFDAPNPHVPWPELALRVPTALESWPHAGRRHAGVSSFGFSGTNAHAVLRSAPAAPAADRPAPTGALLVLALSAADEAALAALAERMRVLLRDASAAMALDVCYSAAAGRSALRRRTAAVGRTAAELVAGLVPTGAGRVHGHPDGSPLAALASAFVRGERVDLATPLAALGGRRIDVPLYPFQHRRFVRERPDPALALQLLTESELPIDAAPLPAAARRLRVAGSLAPAVRRHCVQTGAQLDDDAEPDLEVFVAGAAESADDTARELSRFVRWLQAAASCPCAVLCAGAMASAPLALALRAALRTARIEWRDRAVRWIAADASAAPGAVAAALLSPGAEELVVRGAAQFAVHTLPAPASQGRLVLDAARSYLVTGGGGAFGTQLAGFLLASGARHLWLLSRAAATVPPAIAEQAARLGARVAVLAADVADGAALAATLARIDREGPLLDGVFHLAGVVDDARIEAIAPERLQAQLAAKLHGTWHLHAATADRGLRHFVAISSAAAWLGNPGQLAYAAANGALEGVCRLRRSMGLPATSIAFGPLAGLGMANQPGVAAHLQALGIRLLAPAAALTALAAVLQADTPSVAVVDVDWRRLLRAATPASAARFGQAPPTDQPTSPSPLALVAARPAAIAAVVATVLGQPLAAVGDSTPLAQLGLDSLLAVDVQHRLAAELGLELAIGTILSAVDCRALAAAAAAPAAPGPADGDATDELQRLIAGLDDAEVRALLERGRGPGTAPAP